jgi:hypothetical protein
MQQELFPCVEGPEVVPVRAVRRKSRRGPARPVHRQRAFFAVRDLFDANEAWALRLAARQHAKLPPQVVLDEVEQAARVGLYLAARRWDAAAGVKFRTFATRRVMGAIQDYLRELDWFPRRRFRERGVELPRRLDDAVELTEWGGCEVRPDEAALFVGVVYVLFAWAVLGPRWDEGIGTNGEAWQPVPGGLVRHRGPPA